MPQDQDKLHEKDSQVASQSASFEITRSFLATQVPAWLGNVFTESSFY